MIKFNSLCLLLKIFSLYRPLCRFCTEHMSSFITASSFLLFSLLRQFAGLIGSHDLQLRKAFYHYHLQVYSTPPTPDGALPCGLPLWQPPRGNLDPTSAVRINYIHLALSLPFPWVTFCRHSIDSPVRSWGNAPPLSAFNRFRGGTGEVINSLRGWGKWREGKGVCMGWGSQWQVGIITRQMRSTHREWGRESYHGEMTLGSCQWLTFTKKVYFSFDWSLLLK